MSEQIPNKVTPQAIYLARVLAGVTATLFLLSVIMVAIRLRRKVKRDGNIGWDGLCIILGLVSALGVSAVFTRPQLTI